MKHEAYLFMKFLVMMATIPFCAFSQEADGRWTMYQDEIRSRPSGVYEREGDLFVHVRLPMRKLDMATKMRMKSVMTARELLRQWAIEQTAPSRAKDMAAPMGLSLASKTLDDANPLWRYEWAIKLDGPQQSGKEKNEFLFCTIFRKGDVLKQIPASFSRRIPEKSKIFTMLRHFLPEMRKRDFSRLCSACGAVDVCTNALCPDSVQKQLTARNAKIAAYLAADPYAVEVRARAARLRGPNVSERWENLAPVQVVETNVSVTVVTNVMADAKMTEEVSARPETAVERAELGIADKSEFSVKTRTTDMEEIVEKKIVTHVVTTKTIRRKIVTETCASPLFEDLFLAGGTAVNTPRPQTALGEAAAMGYFNDEITFEEREAKLFDAVRENPGDCQLWNMYGHCRLKRGDVIGALICFRNALVLDSANEYALINTAIVYHKLGYAELACGLAVLVRGTTDQPWCVKKAEEILLHEGN